MKYVIGHKNPDTDAICSSVVYQSYLEKTGVESKVYALGTLSRETQFVFDKLGIEPPQVQLELPAGSEVILLDHNEAGQSIDNLAELDLVGIIDHHKVDVKTSKPIEMDIQPIGSSCSIVAKKFFASGVELSKEEATMLISGILSDTLYFRSPTSTAEDKEILEKLNKVAEISDVEAYSLEMFNAKSDLGDIDVESLITLDYKEFTFGGDKYTIGVMETTSPSYGLGRLDEIKDGLKAIQERDGLKGIIFTIVDILNEESYTATSDEDTTQLFKEVFNAEERDGTLYVDNLVSRKKQIVPALEERFNG